MRKKQHAVFKRITERSFLFILSLLFIGFNSLSYAGDITEQIQIPSSPNPVGSGARALGMGGAFIAVADDATAASWNPGGLIQLERPEISFVGAYFNRSVDNTFIDIPEASGEHDVSETRLNYLSLSYPFQLFNRNMTVSVNYQNLYDMTNKWSFPVYQRDDNFDITQTVDTTQNGSLSAMGLAYCIEVIQNLSLGVTFNIWDDGTLCENRWEQTTNRTASGLALGQLFTGESYNLDQYEFDGFNMNFGFLWNITGKWTLGGVLKTPFTADLRHSNIFILSQRFPEISGSETGIETSNVVNEKLTMPMSYGVGVAYRMSDNFTISMDFYRTEWGDFIHEDADGNKSSAVSGKSENESDIDATHQIRLGAEYLFIQSKYAIPLRGGVFYDPAPSEGSSDDFFGVSIGSGIAYGRIVFDIACQYRFGNDVGESFSTINQTQDLSEITIYSSLIIHF